MPVLNQALCHGDIGGSVSIAAQLLSLAVDGGDWSASHPYHFTRLGNRTLGRIEHYCHRARNVEPKARRYTSNIRRSGTTF
jgi:hypothetical protein